MAGSTHTTLFRFWIWLIALVGVIVPRRLRADWRQEWEAELRSREELLAEWDKLNWHTKLDLLRRSLGAFRDALLLQPRRLEDEMFQDLRFGARLLAKKPGFTLLAVATLALGIGVNTAIFTGFNLLFRPRPIKDPDTVVKLDHRGGAYGLFSYSEYVAFRERAQTISEWLPSFGERFLLGETTAGVEPEEIGGTFVSENYLSHLGGRAQIGRFFTAEENRVAGRDAVVVLSHQFWQRRFAGNPLIVGQSLLLDGKPFIVIGVTNPAFVGLNREAPDIWLPLMMRAAMPSVHTEDFAGANPDWFGKQDYQWLSLSARLKPGRTIVEAQAEMSLLFGQLPRPTDQTASQGAIAVTAVSGQELRRAAFRNTMALTLGASGLVLLIACSNLANMLLARAAARQKEIGVRLALGASRLRVMRQLLTESFLLAGLGGAAGVLLAWWSCEMFLPLVFARWSGGDFARMALSLTPDWRVLSFALLLSLLSGLAFGLVPALRGTKPNLIAVIKDDSAAFGGRLARSWLRNGLVVAQVALCLALLIPAGLLLRGLAKALSDDPGFETKKLLIVFYSLELSGYDEARMQLFHQQLQERLQSLPGVAKVSPNFGFGGRATLVLPAEQGASEKRFEPAPFRWVSSDYFGAVGTPLRQGRDFTAEEARIRAPVVIVSESTANRLWPNENPLGKTIRAERHLRNGAIQIELPSAQVIGVARDAHTWRVGEIPPLFFYAPAVERKWGVEGSFLVRATRDAASLKELALKEALALEPVLRFDSFTMEESIARDGKVIEARNVSELATVLGSLALALAALGIYGTLAFTVAQRTREIGIRMALGAQARIVQMLVVRQAMTLVFLGVLIGIPISIAATRV
ncbi:MAG TPA: ADOP family duplicated permease, partial [Blastocatellia bacterium]|nr:ADOP family duplicated permease [Blastocatellia bacterium]